VVNFWEKVKNMNAKALNSIQNDINDVCTTVSLNGIKSVFIIMIYIYVMSILILLIEVVFNYMLTSEIE